MQKLPAISLAVILGSLACLGQTNSPAPQQWFSLPSPQLRPLTLEAPLVLPGSNSISPEGLSDREPSRISENLSLTATQVAALPEREADSNKPATSPLPQRMTLTSPLSESDLKTYRMLEANGYLQRPAPESDNVFVRIANNIFEPAPIRIGKTTVACSVITAIKKKNPLCLLNPIVLSISW